MGQAEPAEPSGPDSLALPEPRSNRGLVVLTVAIALLAVALVAYRFWPHNGTLMVTVWGPNHAAVDMLEIRVDDRLVCSKSPCNVQRLEAGRPHTVAVVAPGYVKSATRAAEIETGKIALVEFELTRATTGVHVGALAPNLRLFVDGNDRGPLPASIEDLKPGSHAIRIEGNERYKPYEEELMLGAGEIKTLEPKLKVAKGLAKLEPGTSLGGARVWLVCGSEPKVDLRLPTVREIPVDKGCRVDASRPGYEDSSVELTFDESHAEKVFTIDVAKPGAAPAAPPTPAPARAVSRARSGGAKVAKASTTPAPAPAPKAVPAGPTGFIQINSIPVSSVSVDGRPAGQTPTRVTVPPGNHTVVFVHPERGQKAMTVKVTSGNTASAVVTF